MILFPQMLLSYYKLIYNYFSVAFPFFFFFEMSTPCHLCSDCYILPESDNSIWVLFIYFYFIFLIKKNYKESQIVIKLRKESWPRAPNTVLLF